MITCQPTTTSTIHAQQRGSVNSSGADTSRLAKLTSGALPMCGPETCEVTTSAISSPALEGGPSRYEWLGCQMIFLFGREAVPVSRSASGTLSKQDSQTSGTCGLSGSLSSRSTNLQLCLGNKLQTRWAKAGGTLLRGTWKTVTTPLGRQFCQLVATVRTMKGSGCSGLPTPTARDGKDISSGTAYLAARQRHSPSLATHLITLGAPWRAVSSIYCNVMGYPSKWNEMQLKATATQSFRRSVRSLSKPISKQ